jgi:AcrR family transcriptional regulator
VFSEENRQTDLVSAPRTARERVREEVAGEILAVARAQLAQDGAAALSLRSIARELEMAPSALYRYFSGRDALLSALILSAYESLADEAERASVTAFAKEGTDAERWLVVPRTMRGWALGHPHEWGLIFGTPVPGYHAPEDTVVPYARLAGALVQPMIDAQAAGRLTVDVVPVVVSEELAAAVAPVSNALFAAMPTPKVILLLQAWATLVGVISLELFGHWRNTVLDPELFFDQTVRSVGYSLGLT